MTEKLLTGMQGIEQKFKKKHTKNIIKKKKKIHCQKVSNACDSSILLLQFPYIFLAKLQVGFVLCSFYTSLG